MLHYTPPLDEDSVFASGEMLKGTDKIAQGLVSGDNILTLARLAHACDVIFDTVAPAGRTSVRGKCI